MQLRQALHFFQLISRSNLQPTVVSFNAIISAFEKGGQWQYALKLGEMSIGTVAWSHPFTTHLLRNWYLSDSYTKILEKIIDMFEDVMNEK